MLKRIGLFLLTNLAVMLVLSVVLTLLQSLGLMNFGGAYGPMLVTSAVFGFGGALISLALSKWMAKRSTGARVIETPRTEEERWLVENVRQLAQSAGIRMPEIAIFPAAEPNAFATGMRRNASLVAVSEGLLRGMQRSEVRAVLGHEIAHVANGDMVTLSLLQGVLNTFVFFFARVVGRFVDAAMRGDRDGGVGMGYYIVRMLAEMIFGVLASMLVMAFSRYREFRADAGGAKLAGRSEMIAALKRLAAAQGAPAQLPSQLQAFGIRGGGLSRWLSSHPPLAARIAALEAAR